MNKAQSRKDGQHPEIFQKGSTGIVWAPMLSPWGGWACVDSVRGRTCYVQYCDAARHSARHDVAYEHHQDSQLLSRAVSRPGRATTSNHANTPIHNVWEM